MCPMTILTLKYTGVRVKRLGQSPLNYLFCNGLGWTVIMGASFLRTMRKHNKRVLHNEKL